MYYIQKRNIALYIVLTFLTCGIFYYYWLYKMAQDINAIRENPGDTSPGMVVLFSIITCGIYSIYWYYKAGETIDLYYANRGMMTSGSKSTIYLVLMLCGYITGSVTQVVAWGLLQSDLNKIADDINTGNYQEPYTDSYSDPFSGGSTL